MQGYRVISVDIPRVWNHQEWIQAFEKFLDAIDVHHVSTLFTFSTLKSLNLQCPINLILFNITDIIYLVALGNYLIFSMHK